MFNQSLILLIILSFLDIFLGVFVLLKNPKAKINRSLFLFSFSLLIWINALYFEDEFTNLNLTNFFLRLDYVSGAFASFFLLMFCLDVIKAKIANSLIFRFFLIAIPSIIFFVAFFSKFIISHIEEINGVFNPVFGFGGIIYNLTISFILLFGIGSLIYKYFNTKDEDKKNQLIYLFIGFLLCFVIIFLFNILLVEYIKNSPNYLLYSRLGPFSTIFVVIAAAYTIIRHRLLNIKVITTEIISFGILIFSLFQTLTAKNLSELIINGLIFITLLFLVIMLMRSVENEVKRKEQLQIMSDKLSKANDQLRKLDNAKSEFISIASHQLRTPLTAIKGFISLILEGSYGRISKEIENVLNKVYLSNERLIELVEDLLNLSRIESGRMEYKFEKINLGEVCQEVYDTFVLRAKEKKLKLDLILAKDSDMIATVDRNKIREVISNLVDNALKYTPKGGVKIKLLETNKTVQVAIIDTGIGVPKEEIPYLFSKFSRGKDISRLNASGTGLGLHVGKKMVEALGGKIWVESAGTNLGSTFIIEVPKEHLDKN